MRISRLGRFVLPSSRNKQIVPTNKSINIQSLELVVGSFNNVIRIKTIDEKVFYFKRSVTHIKYKEYIKREVDFYFSHFEGDESFKRIICESLKKKWRRFANLGDETGRFSHLHHYLMSKDPGYFGLVLNENDILKFNRFLFYLNGVENQYQLHLATKTNDLETHTPCRYLSTSLISELLGIDDYFPKAEFVTFEHKGEVFVGTLIEEASGTLASSLSTERRKEVLSPFLKNALSNLEAFDHLTNDNDHNIFNYNIDVDSDQAVGITVFDNDSPLSYSVGSSLNLKTSVLQTRWEKHGRIMRDYIDNDFAKRFLSLSEESFVELKNFLNRRQYESLLKRFRKMKKVYSAGDKLSSSDKPIKDYVVSFCYDRKK